MSDIVEPLTKSQRSRLSRYVCWGCELSLDKTIRGPRGQCGSILMGPCEVEVIRKRAIDCLLAARKPEIADVSAIAETPTNSPAPPPRNPHTPRG